MKCHSCRSESETGAAWNEGLGLGAVELSSAVSFRRRRRVGEGAMVIEGACERGSALVVGELSTWAWRTTVCHSATN